MKEKEIYILVPHRHGYNRMSSVILEGVLDLQWRITKNTVGYLLDNLPLLYHLYRENINP